jgi:Ca2+-binding EF-hand superfamily protein
MSKEAEEFFRQKTIENAKRPRMKKFLALVNREAEGKIMQEYADQQFRLYDVSQQRELLLAYHRYLTKELSLDLNELWVDEHLKANNYY